MPSDQHNLRPWLHGLYFFHYLMSLQPERSPFVFHSSLLTEKVLIWICGRMLALFGDVNCSSSYFDYKGTFQTAVGSYRCVTG